MRKMGVMMVAGCMLSACAQQGTTYNENPNTYKGAGIGAVLGGAAGAMTGNNTNEKLKRGGAGAAIGALAGGAIGQYMDRQEQQMRQELQGSGVDVQRQGDNILLNMPNSITFAFDSSRIKQEFYPTLNNVSGVLNQYPNTNIEVIGHTDSTGTTAYNQNLSEERARAVSNYLRGQNVQADRLYLIGRGESQPIASNDTENGRAQNRRVEVRISPIQQ